MIRTSGKSDSLRWVLASLLTHGLLLALAGAAWALEWELSLPWQALFGFLGLGFAYLLLTAGPPADGGGYPKLAMLYFTVFTVACIFLAKGALSAGQALPTVPARLAVLAGLLPFSMVVRIGRRPAR